MAINPFIFTPKKPQNSWKTESVFHETGFFRDEKTLAISQFSAMWRFCQASTDKLIVTTSEDLVTR